MGCARCGEDLTDTACTGHVAAHPRRHRESRRSCVTPTPKSSYCSSVPPRCPGALPLTGRNARTAPVRPGVKAYVVHLLIAQGGIFPDVFFQRMEDEIEISWGDRIQPGADAATFVVEDGIARVAVDEVATTLFDAVEWFLAQDGICASEWGTELTNRWNEMCGLTAGEVALSWYLDSNPEPKSLTKTFTTAMKKLGRGIGVV